MLLPLLLLGLLVGLHRVHHLPGVHLDLGLVPGQFVGVLLHPGHIVAALVGGLQPKALHHCQNLGTSVEAWLPFS